MNHDATHCLDYVEGVCPMNCYRAELTEDLKNGRAIGVPVSWASFIYSEECAFRLIPWPRTPWGTPRRINNEP